MDNNTVVNGNEDIENARYLSPLSVWALSFGCAVGWGAFVMPGTTFLPKAGPLGTVIGMIVGAIIMYIIGINYCYLMNRYPDSGGTLTYTIKAFGYDHGFLSSWFLILVYVAIMWANASALPLMGRNLMGRTFQFGFHYQILGYDVYMGEVILSLAAIIVVGIICMNSKRIAVGLQVLFALLLFAGIVICFVCVFGKGAGSISFSPCFSDNEKLPVGQIFTIIALSPWAFVGFESVSNSAEGFRFPVRKTITIISVALIIGVVSYILLVLMASASQPAEYENWSSYIGDLGNNNGLAGLPTFYVVHTFMGKAGIAILGIAAVSGIITGLIGNYIAAGRLLYSMACEKILPSWFGRLNDDKTPGNSLLFLMCISLIIPFLGRTAIGWIIDVNTVGATIAYAYTSATALYLAKKENNTGIKVTGTIGICMSILFFFYFMTWSAGAMSTESYLILATWSILGFIWFRVVFSHDEERRFGKSTVVWLGLLFLIFFTSLMWVKQATDEMTKYVVENVSEYYEERNPDTDPDAMAETEEYLSVQLTDVNKILTRNSVIQMILITAALGIMFSIYTTISQREKQAEAQKIKAEESNRAKTDFLSNMSHDIRTPMNAIIGYINLAERDAVSAEDYRTYINKIKGSSQHLLALINDVLEMSRIESGKMELEPVAVDLIKTFDEVKDMFQTQMSEKNIEFVVDSSNIKRNRVLCDKNLLNRVLLNLVSNAYKFTPSGGTISVKVWEVDIDDDNYGKYEIRVADSGIGMSPEFAAKVFEAFERERTSTVSGIQGTGLGMSITKNIIDLMGGTIDVNTAQGVGTEFIIKLRLELQEPGLVEAEEESKEDVKKETNVVDFSKMRLLLVEDMEVNREIAVMLLSGLGFTIETAVNGQDAVDKVKASEKGYYDAVLMDIQMPVMNGYDATKAIRELDDQELSSIPIIAMTANAFSEDVKRAHDAGMNAHIAKPIDVNTMTNVLREILG
ncbi:MAG: amino acid permease [Lachnospiraceae bacterium]|nr:amino acid permease [Lachnospiraceae bacterium]